MKQIQTFNDTFLLNPPKFLEGTVMSFLAIPNIFSSLYLPFKREF